MNAQFECYADEILSAMHEAVTTLQEAEQYGTQFIEK